MDTLQFVFFMLRPRAILWTIRLGKFESICYSMDYFDMQRHAWQEKRI